MSVFVAPKKVIMRLTCVACVPECCFSQLGNICSIGHSDYSSRILSQWRLENIAVKFSRVQEMSRLVGKPTIWFPNRSDTNRAVQTLKQARSLKLRIQEEEEVYYSCSENKGADQRLPRS